MKKIYVLAAFLGASTFAFNQVTRIMHLDNHAQPKMVNENVHIEKALGAELFAYDFSDATQWTITSSGSQGTWVIGTEADMTVFNFQGQQMVLEDFLDPNDDYTFTSEANGGAFFDGISSYPVFTDQDSYLEMTNSIDLSAQTMVVLQFEQEYKSFSFDEISVEVSLDGGTTWEQTKDIRGDMSGNEFSNGTVRKQFNVNNSSTVKFRFHWSCASGGGYGWFIDDISIQEPTENDVYLADQFYGFQLDPSLWGPTDLIRYGRIPLDQIQPIMTTVVIENKGSLDQPNVYIETVDTTGTYTSTSDTVVVFPAYGNTGYIDTLTTQQGYAPTTLGLHKLETTIKNDSTDDVPSNNVVNSYTFDVTNYLYATDVSATVPQPGSYVRNIYNGAFTITSTQETINQFEAGNLFTIGKNADLTGIDFQFGDSIAEGSLVFGKLYEIEFTTVTDSTFQYQITGVGDAVTTLPYVVQSGDEGKYVTLVFDQPQALTAGKNYIVSVTSAGKFSVAQYGEARHFTSSWLYAADISDPSWLLIGRAPVVRMNFDPTLAVADNNMLNLELTQYPNPFANETTVSFNLQEATSVSYTVTNIAGQVVVKANEGNLTAGEHSFTIDGSSLTNGVYFLNLQTENGQVTRKMIVNK